MAQTTLRGYLETAEEAISSGHINDALATCEYMLTLYPESLEAHRLLGEVYLAQEQLDDARRAFDWVLNNDPENVIAYCDRALISERQLDYDTALDCYQQAYELSRGNQQIRQEFNQLSQQVGQRGLIFSRAGLARLYMRGDLLPEAIQEWEVVLTSTPDRIDARIGLLETCWREGYTERVEQMATQIMLEIPGCLKALLLLAHVTYPRDARKGQALLQQAEALDPEYVMAQELFSDYMASHPTDAFVSLIQQKQRALTTAHRRQPAAAAPPVEGSPASAAVVSEAASDADPTVWGSVTTLSATPQEYQHMQPIGAPSANGTPQLESVNTFNQIDDALAQRTLEPEAAPMAAEPTGDNATLPISEQATGEMPPWYALNSYMEPADGWGAGEIAAPGEQATWEMETRAQPLPKPPAWLEMLTRGEKHQPVAPATVPAAAATDETEVAAAAITAEQPAAVESQMPPPPTEHVAQGPQPEPESEPFFARALEEGNSFFGPEWLKALGARILEAPAETVMSAVPVTPDEPVKVEDTLAPVAPTAHDETHDETPGAGTTLPEEQIAASEANMQAEPQPPAAQDELSMFDASSEMPPWGEAAPTEQPRELAAQPASLEEAFPEAEQEAALQQPRFTTLEELEKDLIAQGFIPVDLSAISMLTQEQEPSLSSALAQFGALDFQAAPPVYASEETAVAQNDEFAEEAAPVVSASEEQDAPSAISPASEIAAVAWEQAELEQTSVTEADAQEEELEAARAAEADAQEEELEAARAAEADAQEEEQPEAVAATESVPSEQPQSPAFAEPTSVAAAPAQAETAAHKPMLQAPAAHEIELETTMRRPFFWQLQAVQPEPVAQQDASSGKRAEGVKAAKAGAEELKGKERLLKGYQHQLAGSYDQAMQEYRVVIRSAPELLGEVVSNMRALLKIAPKYVPGYRVLGDAYMRQGEYLQAMEAYNKALSMVKKGKA